MGKSKGRSRHNRDQEPTERINVQNLKSIIRKLKKENERLRRELKRRGDISEEYSELLQEVESLDTPAPREDACPACGKGSLKTTPLGIFTFVKCGSCKYQKVLK